jgi:hypothetical protein
LTTLFARAFPAASVVAQGGGDAELMRLAEAAAVDCQVAIGSLPLQFRLRDEDFAAAKGAYLEPDPARVGYWRERLAALGHGFKVGISWAGGAASTGGASRSTQLAEWTPILANTHCHFVNLQYGDAATESQPLSGAVSHWPEALDNYAETAALVAALDLVVTVQTALVHLAGALGKPAWVMLQAACEWRYGEHGETMPWYPSVRLVRQSVPHDWRPVISRIAHDLAQLSAR